MRRLISKGLSFESVVKLTRDHNESLRIAANNPQTAKDADVAAMEEFRTRVTQWATDRYRWEWTLFRLAQQHVQKVYWYKNANALEIMAAMEASAYNNVTTDQVVEKTIRDATATRELILRANRVIYNHVSNPSRGGCSEDSGIVLPRRSINPTQMAEYTVNLDNMTKDQLEKMPEVQQMNNLGDPWKALNKKTVTSRLQSS